MIESVNIERINTSWMHPGTFCWVKVGQNQKSNCVYRKGIIVGLDKNRQNANINYDKSRQKGPQVVPVKILSQANMNLQNGQEGWQDMVGMNVLNEAEILNNTWIRFQQDKIYTYIGPTLLAMNPYKRILGMFSTETLKIFQNLVINSIVFNAREAPPHIFAIAACSYLQLFDKQKNQAIVISGESGAGQTENAKYAMNFITSLSSVTSGSPRRSPEKDHNQLIEKEDTPIEDKILRCNPILEAFGNSQTLRNDNSSRFGKYVRIWIDQNSRKILGASITNYLLQKSRVTLVSPGQRNYHIFYHMLMGMNKQELNSMWLTPNQKKEENMKYWQSFKYFGLNSSFQVDTIQDQQLYMEVMQSFKRMNFHPLEVEAIFQLLAGILHLGNLAIDGTQYTQNTPCQITTQQILTFSSKNLSVIEQSISKCILLKTREIGKQVIESPMSQKDCISVRDSLARAIYDKIFTWLVMRLNETILPRDFEPSQTLSLGLLDIFGFENFQINSFQQLCINFTNEKLQQLYISYVFQSEEQQFLDEGLKDYITSIKYTDNQAIIDLIDQSPSGIFDSIDDSCQMGNGTDEQLLNQIVKNQEKNQNFKSPQILSDQFTIMHTAQQVEYTISGFRQQNKDEISREMDQYMSQSQNIWIVKIWQCDPLYDQSKENGENTGSSQGDMKISNAPTQPPVSKGKNDKFLGAQFRNQMKELMSELNACDVHFVRCIQPNQEKKKDHIVGNFVMQQIRYLGVLQSIRIRQMGFPIRMDYSSFYLKYHELDLINRRIRLQRHIDMKTDMMGLSKEIFRRVIPDFNMKSVLFGLNQVYMRVEVINEIDKQLQEWWKFKNRKALMIQQQYKIYLFKKGVRIGMKKIQFIVRKVVYLQSFAQMKLAQRKFIALKNRLKGFLKLTQTVKKVRTKYKSITLSLLYGILMRKKKGEKWKKAFSLIDLATNQYKKRLGFDNWSQQSKQMTQIQKEENEIQQRLKVEEEEQQKLKEAQQTQQKLIKQEKTMIQMEEEEAQIKQTKENLIQREKTDDFTTEGLFIWPFDPSYPYPIEKFHEQNSIPQQYLDFPEKFVVPEEYQISSLENSREDILSYSDLTPQFLKKVQQAMFLEFCQNFILKGKNWKTGTQIQQIMSFSQNNLIEPLTKGTNASCLIWSNQVYRSLLKLSGSRNSRYPESAHVENIIAISLGQTPSIKDLSMVTVLGNEQYKDEENDQGDPTTPSPNYNSTMLMPSGGMMNAQNVLMNRVKLVTQNSIIRIREEIYFQICKHIEGNVSPQSVKKLIQFTALIVNLFPPSYQAIFAILNFFYTRGQKQKDPQVAKDIKYIFMKLTLAAQAYPIVADPDPLNVSPSQIAAASVFKQEDIQSLFKRTREGKTSAFDLFFHFLSVVQPRKSEPIKEEIQIINLRKQRKIKIRLPTQQILWTNIESYFTVKETKDIAVKMIDMAQRSPYFSLFEVKKLGGVIIEERFLNDTSKLSDILSKHDAEIKEFKDQNSQQLQFLIYLRVRIYYRLYKDDIDSINFFFMQVNSDVRRGKLPIQKDDAIILSALDFYSQQGPYSPEQESKLKTTFQSLIPPNVVGMGTNDEWWLHISENYRRQKFESRTAARWDYLNIVRPYDLFLTFQFEAQLFHVIKSTSGYIKHQDAEDSIVAVRPGHVIIANLQSQKTLQIIQYSSMTQWGQSVGTPPYFFIRCENDDLYILAFKFIEIADYIINAYVNWQLSQPSDNNKHPNYNDVLSFVISGGEKGGN